MSKRSLVRTLLCLSIVACGERGARKNSQSLATPAEQSTGQDVWRQFRHKAGEQVRGMLDAGKPRIVPRGAKPEIVIKDAQIFIDGNPVEIGQSVDLWKKAIPGKSRCDEEHNVVQCEWDDFGISLLAENRRVNEFSVHFNLAPWGPFAQELPDGTPVPPPKDWRPKHPFRGYFEMDGYGIDANTRFWEIRASVDPARNLRCDFLTNNCGSTTGRFAKGTKMYFELYETTSENGRLETFAIGSITSMYVGSNKPPSSKP